MKFSINDAEQFQIAKFGHNIVLNMGDEYESLGFEHQFVLALDPRIEELAEAGLVHKTGTQDAMLKLAAKLSLAFKVTSYPKAYENSMTRWEVGGGGVG